MDIKNGVTLVILVFYEALKFIFGFSFEHVCKVSLPKIWLWSLSRHVHDASGLIILIDSHR